GDPPPTTAPASRAGPPPCRGASPAGAPPPAPPPASSSAPVRGEWPGPPGPRSGGARHGAGARRPLTPAAPHRAGASIGGKCERAARTDSGRPVGLPGTTLRLGALDERAQPLAPRRVAQLPQRLRLDLPDALEGHLEVLTHLFQGVVRLLADAEPHPEDLLLARGEGGEHLPGL